MAFSLIGATPYVHGYDFTGDSNKILLDAQVTDEPTTTFASGGWRSRTGGLKSMTLHLEGLWSSLPDAEAFGDLGVVDRVATVSPTGAAGSVAYMAQVEKQKYHAFGQMGMVAPFVLDA